MASRHWLPPCARPSLVSRATAESGRTPVTPDERQAIAAECAEAAREIADLMHRLDRLLGTFVVSLADQVLKMGDPGCESAKIAADRFELLHDLRIRR